MDNRLDWRHKTDAVYKKEQSRIYFWRKPRSFSVFSKMLHIVYMSLVESAVSSAVGWGSSIMVIDLKRKKKNKASVSVLGTILELIVQTILHKTKNILDNTEHPPHNRVSSVSLLQIHCNRPLQENLPSHSNNH